MSAVLPDSQSPRVRAAGALTVPLSPWTARVPGRALYLLFSFTRLVTLQFPWWFLKFFILRRIPKAHPRWDAKTSFLTAATARFLEIMSTARIQPALIKAIPKPPMTKSTHFIWVPRVDESYMQYGEAVAKNMKGVSVKQATQIPAFWYAPEERMMKIKAQGQGSTHRPILSTVKEGADPGAPNGVVLYLHGGGYIALTTAEHDLAMGLVKNLSTRTGFDVLALEYRLAPRTTYPGQLQDAICAYLYLTQTLSIPSSRIVICGDSSGANLSLALLGWIADARTAGAPDVSVPSAAFLISPWVDLSLSLSTAAAQQPGVMDIVTAEFGMFGKSAFLHGYEVGKAVFSPHISPIYASPERLAAILPHNTYIAIGGGEFLRPEAELLLGKARGGRAAMLGEEGAARALATRGKPYLGRNEDGSVDEQYGIVWDVVDDAVHDYPTTPMFVQQSKRLFARVAQWLEDALDAPMSNL